MERVLASMEDASRGRTAAEQAHCLHRGPKTETSRRAFEVSLSLPHADFSRKNQVPLRPAP